MLYYSTASTAGADQPTWVTVNYSAPNGAFLIARIDTLGSVSASRNVNYPSMYNGNILNIAALDNGSSVCASYINGQALVFQLGENGSTAWSKQIGLNTGAGQNFNPLGIAAVGNNVLLCGSINIVNQRVFVPIANDGSAVSGTSYVLPMQQATGFVGSIPIIKPLPAGSGVITLEQVDRAKYLLASVDGNGQMRWLKQLDLAGLPSSISRVSFDIAVSPTSGNLAVLVAVDNAGIAQLVRLSSSGALLNATNYTVSLNSSLRFGRLAVGTQDEAAWTLETSTWLYYYGIGSQGQTLVSKQLAAAPNYNGSIVVGGYGLVGIGRKGAYALGSFAGPSPTNYANSSINYLRINAAGQAGCNLADAPALSSSTISTTQITTLPIPIATSVPASSTSYNLTNTPSVLTVSTVCQ